MKIAVDDLSHCIERELDAYQKSTVETVRETVDSVTERAVHKLKVTSPNKSGAYSRGWKSTVTSDTTTVSSVWNGIKTSISNAINGAKEVVSNAINAIKNLFNFKISWPHIPLPHFSVSGSANPLDWITKGVPKISIDWYAKGGILTKPTAFGLNGNRLMVGGEAGNEAILPLNDKTLGAIGRGIAQTMSGLKNEFHITISGNTVKEEADITKIANLVSQRIAEELERKTQLKGGRI